MLYRYKLSIYFTDYVLHEFSHEVDSADALNQKQEKQACQEKP